MMKIIFCILILGGLWVPPYIAQGVKPAGGGTAVQSTPVSVATAVGTVPAVAVPTVTGGTRLRFLQSLLLPSPPPPLHLTQILPEADIISQKIYILNPVFGHLDSAGFPHWLSDGFAHDRNYTFQEVIHLLDRVIEANGPRDGEIIRIANHFRHISHPHPGRKTPHDLGDCIAEHLLVNLIKKIERTRLDRIILSQAYYALSQIYSHFFIYPYKLHNLDGNGDFDAGALRGERGDDALHIMLAPHNPSIPAAHRDFLPTPLRKADLTRIRLNLLRQAILLNRSNWMAWRSVAYVYAMNEEGTGPEFQNTLQPGQLCQFGRMLGTAIKNTIADRKQSSIIGPYMIGLLESCKRKRD